VLAGVRVQIEPHAAGAPRAERFLRDAGVGDNIVPCRPRPRASKQLTAIVGAAFRDHPQASQDRLRASLLGPGPIPRPIVDWTARALTGAPARRAVLLWARHGRHQSSRNTPYPELVDLAARARSACLVPILFGDAVGGGGAPLGTIDLTLCWREPVFQGADLRRAQLQLFELLRRDHGVVGQIGVTTAGMDGPALLGLPTLYLTDAPNPRMRGWVGAVPGYQEIVRGAGYLDRVSRAFRCWAA
jgi:hypothetical protein